MTKFSYKAQSSTGQIVTGETESLDKFSLARDMKAKNFFVISAKEINPKRKLSSFVNLSFGGVKELEKIQFTRNLGAMIEAGLPLTRSLSVFERQSKNKYFKKILKSLREDVTKGQELNVALGVFPNIFSPLTIAMVRAGEKSGNISGSLKIVAEQLEQNYLLRKRVKGALIYPSIILSAMVIIGIIMLLYVVPTLTATFKELSVELPFATKLIILASDALRNNLLLFILGVIGVAVLGSYAFRSPLGKKLFEIIILRSPILGVIVRKINAARTARTLSSLLSSGVDIIEALSITENVIQSSHFKKVLEEAGVRVGKGVALSVVFSEHDDLYPILLGELVAVGEETGKLSEMLKNLAVFYEDEVTQVTKDLSTIVEPILMMIIGAGVGFFAFSMITPLYTVLGGI